MKPPYPARTGQASNDWQGGLLARDRPTGGQVRKQRGFGLGRPVRTVRAAKDRKLLGRRHVSSDAGSGRRAGRDAEQAGRGERDVKAAPQRAGAPNATR